MEQVKNLIFQNDNFTFYAVALALTLTVVICLVQVIRTPPILRRRFDRAVRCCGLHNAQNEYPALVSVKRDKGKPHGLILKVNNKGLSLPDFNSHYERLRVIMGGIFRMEYGCNINYTLLYFLPQKYIRPALFTPDDSALGSIDVKHIINMLIVGATGTGKTVALKILLTKIARFQSDAKIWLLDFKQFDFQNLSDKPRYYGYADCLQGLEDYYAAFKQQQESGTAGAPQYLIIDEWGSFLLSLDKKTAEQAKTRLASFLLSESRGRMLPILPGREITFNAALLLAISAVRGGGCCSRMILQNPLHSATSVRGIFILMALVSRKSELQRCRAWMLWTRRFKRQ